MSLINVAVVQFHSFVRNIERNRLQIVSIMKRINQKEPETDLILFPEASLYGYDQLDDSIHQNYQVELLDTLKFIGTCARRLDVNVVLGYPRYDSEVRKQFNRIVYLNRKGQLICHYDKMHLTPFDKQYFTEGSNYLLLKTELGTLGFLICWDLCFPEVSNLYKRHGADILLAPAAWESPFEKQYEVMARARAIENGMYVVTANQIGTTSNNYFFGGSMIVNRSGGIIGRTMGSCNSYIICQIDIKNNHSSKKTSLTVPCFERRVETYNDSYLTVIE